MFQSATFAARLAWIQIPTPCGLHGVVFKIQPVNAYKVLIPMQGLVLKLKTSFGMKVTYRFLEHPEVALGFTQ